MSYPKSAQLTGYRGILQRIPSKYLRNNGYPVVAPYMPDAAGFQILDLTFSAAPDDTSSLSIPDSGTPPGATAVKNFVFTYSGSPGVGIIPLVAGGGTAAQAATATQVALAAQLTQWTVTNPSAGVTRMVSKLRGANLSTAQIAAMLVGTTNITITNFATGNGLLISSSHGRSGAFLPA